MERHGLSPARGTVGQTPSTHAGQPGHPVSHSPVSAARLAQARSCLSKGEWLPAHCTGSSDGILRHPAPPHAGAPVGNTQGIPPGPRRHRPPPGCQPSVGTGRPLLAGMGAVCSSFIPARSWGNPTGCPSLTPTEALESHASCLASRGKRGRPASPRSLGPHVPASQRPDAHVLLPSSGLWDSLHGFRGPDGGMGERCVPETRWWGPSGSMGPESLPAGRQGLVRTWVWSSSCRGLSR